MESHYSITVSRNGTHFFDIQAGDSRYGIKKGENKVKELVKELRERFPSPEFEIEVSRAEVIYKPAKV